MGRSNDEVVSDLKKVLSRFDDVRLAYLFGSYAEGREMPISDLDIAILTRDRKVISYLTAEISKTLKIPEEKISIIDIDEAAVKLLQVLS
ncbi:MAG: nucleotidyltransferase domain-containing protein [Candidatus Caldarchaeales archaeon]